MRQKQLITLVAVLLFVGYTYAENDTPSINPTATFFDSDGKEVKENHHTGSAPLAARFEANPSKDSGWQAYYEWQFYEEGKEDSPYLIRYEQDTEYTFLSAGTHNISLHAIFTRGNEKIEYIKDKLRIWYGDEYEEEPSDVEIITASISESKLEMPNAFSPNGDGINEIFGVKNRDKGGFQSIISFHAVIINRWGQKLYEWDDPMGGWDGTYKGSPVKQGVYYVIVNAKGADGRVFNIRRDVNLLRGKNDETSTTSGGGE